MAGFATKMEAFCTARSQSRDIECEFVVEIDSRVELGSGVVFFSGHVSISSISIYSMRVSRGFVCLLVASIKELRRAEMAL